MLGLESWAEEEEGKEEEGFHFGGVGGYGLGVMGYRGAAIHGRDEDTKGGDEGLWVRGYGL